MALSLIWFASPGDAVESSDHGERIILWADQTSDDTIHIQADPEGSAEGIPEKSPGDNYFSSIKMITDAAWNIRKRYMEDVDMEEIIQAGIDGMMSKLDRFSVLMEEESYDALMESTRGNYEGLGIQIDGRDDYITVITPIEGTPAYRKGLRAGDVIKAIDGQTTRDMTSSDAADLMRGTAGTSVVLTIERAGVAGLLEFDLERAVIKLKSVNYSGVIPGTDIGYVRLSRFAEETSRELREAISELNNQNVGSMIFDLRSNGGGLLDQATETAELFLKENSEIVFTKGRRPDQVRHYRSQRSPLFGTDKPLVILVDAGTASSSEIVAGAIQDWDRGLIIGQTTYGKGLVQQLFPVSNDRRMSLKLTTAKYYVPSGRCIQKPERQGRDNVDHASLDEGEESDTISISEREVFYTNGGRIVYGGGGIVPDILVDAERWQPIEINLYRQSMFFDFIIDYVANHPEIKPDAEVTDEMLSEFRAFLKEREFDYKTTLQVALEDLQTTVTEEDSESIFAETIADLEGLIEEEKANDFDKSADYIKRALKREIARSVGGERAVYEEIVLRTDKVVQKAVEVLSKNSDYN
jgi:carboxyl-terminal processing protease